MYVLLTVIFSYGTGAATNVVLIAQYFAGVPDAGINALVSEHGGWMFLTLVFTTLPYIPTMIAGYVLGGKKRRQSRKELYNQT